ncbi:MAG: hypothetical protein U5K32_01890 [Bacteroidales bacterium]|nr:hypothetical protein [Bacteroidales bacterium]
MKKTFIAAFLSIAFIAAAQSSSPVAQGETHSVLGMYTIERSGQFEMIKGDPLRAYEIIYENSPDTICVAVDDSRKDVTRFLVISDRLVIEYICHDKFFGARLIDERFQEEGLSTPLHKLDKKEYYHQKLITQDPKSETEYLKLISVYFPKLIKDYNNILYAAKN